MTTMSRTIVLLTAVAAIMLPAAAQAQYYASPYARQPAPLYPYAVPGDQPYAVQVAPNTYEIRRPAAQRAYPYVRGTGASKPARTAEPRAKRFDRPPKPVDHALIEELRQRHGKQKGTVINTTRIVREKPVVIETKRYVDDPPRIIERHQVVEEDGSVRPLRQKAGKDRDSGKRPARDEKKRVIQAEAEITILGPDRMNIRLFRKGQGGRASAQAE